MITCKQAAELISLAEEAPLGWWRRLRLRAHLLVCDMCRRFLRQVHLLQRAGRVPGQDGGPGPTLSEEARQRMKRALRDQTEGR